MMNGLIIYLNTKCNIDCDYCFVTKKDNVFMDRPRFEKIVRWFMEEEGQDKQISFFGGEPTMNAQLLYGFKDLLKPLSVGKKVEVKEINTNGILVDEEMLARFKEDGIKLIFSLDGLQFEHNKFRINKRATFDRILKNIELYREHYGEVGVNCVVHPTMAEGFDKRVEEFFDNGFNRVRLVPTLGIHWTREQVLAYKESINKIAQLYFRLLKTGRRNFQIHPISEAIERVASRDRGEFFDNKNSCQMGRAAFFMPDGKAYACRSVMYASDQALVKKFYLGHIDTGIDVKKIDTFLNYKVCQDVKTACQLTRPGANCRRLCFCLDTKTGDYVPPEDVTTMIEMDAMPFTLIHNALSSPERKFKIPQNDLSGVHQAK